MRTLLPLSLLAAGDPAAGRRALLDGDYIRCGIPWSIYERYIGQHPADYRIADREGKNATLPYFATAFTAASGVEVVANNCLYCHAARFDGEIVIGLGNPGLDFTTDASQLAILAPLLAKDPAERAEAARWAARSAAVAPAIVTQTVGMNPADTLAQALYAHRDPLTLAWSDEALLEMPAAPVPTDVPPLWNLRKKERMLLTGSGQGNLARIMMTATLLCTDTVAEAEEIYPMFVDIRAYLASLRPPAWPRAVDEALAARGQAVFAASCATCHGAYEEPLDYYPGVVVPAAEVGTDPALASAAADGSTDRFVAWFAGSWFGQDASLVPTDGYMAPPLDGVWITAPYLHNGSIPTLEALLDSARRPARWVRGSSYDYGAVGWVYAESAVGRGERADPASLYDTALLGYGNGGHTYGDALTGDERRAVLEYLKTL